MSGGRFGYKHHQVEWLADEIREFALSGEESEETAIRALKLSEWLYSAARAAKALDWYLSADTSEDEFIKVFDEVQELENDY